MKSLSQHIYEAIKVGSKSKVSGRKDPIQFVIAKLGLKDHDDVQTNDNRAWSWWNIKYKVNGSLNVYVWVMDDYDGADFFVTEKDAEFICGDVWGRTSYVAFVGGDSMYTISMNSLQELLQGGSLSRHGTEYVISEYEMRHSSYFNKGKVK